jgi:hypothetical protein
MDFTRFIELCFLAMFSCALTILWQMKDSIHTLSEKIQVLIANFDRARIDLNDHEHRIRRIECTCKESKDV